MKEFKALAARANLPPGAARFVEQAVRVAGRVNLLLAALAFLRLLEVGLAAAGVEGQGRHDGHGEGLAAIAHDGLLAILLPPVLVGFAWWAGHVLLQWRQGRPRAANDVRLLGILFGAYGTAGAMLYAVELLADLRHGDTLAATALDGTAAALHLLLAAASLLILPVAARAGRPPQPPGAAPPTAPPS